MPRMDIPTVTVAPPLSASTEQQWGGPVSYNGDTVTTIGVSDEFERRLKLMELFIEAALDERMKWFFRQVMANVFDRDTLAVAADYLEENGNGDLAMKFRGA